MSSSIEYCVPGRSYCITNGTAKEHREARQRGYGAEFARRPGIKILSYKGASAERCYPTPKVKGIKTIWKSMLKNKLTEEWKITSVSLYGNSLDFDLKPTNSKVELDSLQIYPEKDMEIWLEVATDGKLPPVKYLIDTYYDHKQNDRKGSYHFRITEFYDRMERTIILIRNDHTSPLFYSYGYHDYLLINEYRD